MSERPRLLDLFCGAGGAAVGYARAGFDVVGVDIKRQPHYPFPFVQGDALAPPVRLGDFDVIHASPPCQAFSALNRAVGNQDSHENLIPPTRALLQGIGLPYVIENVPEAPLTGGVLCSVTFGLEVIRHRRFEMNWPVLFPRCSHKPGGAADGTYVMFGGRSPRAPGRRCPPRAGEREWRDAAGLDWMTVRDARQAIPPVQTAFIGEQLMEQLTRKAVIQSH